MVATKVNLKFQHLCSIRVSSVAQKRFFGATEKSNALCPVRPPQTAFGRVFADGHHGARPPIGSLLGSATVPVAVFGVAPKTVSQTEWFHPWFRRDAAVDFSPANDNAKAQRRRDAKVFADGHHSLRLGVLASWRLILSPRTIKCSNAVRPLARRRAFQPHKHAMVSRRRLRHN